MAGPSLTVIVPLGGVGSRFQNEGHFSRPKPFVRVFGKEMLLWVLDNLSRRDGDDLVLCFNPSWMSLSVWMREVVASKYPRCHLVELPGPTRGAAETVLLALKGVPASVRKKPVMLCDGDTFYTHDIVSSFRAVGAKENACFVFHDTQPKPMYSYCRLGPAKEILETKEKVKISDWANSGCYCFRDGEQLEAECAALLAEGEMQLSQDKVPEYYTSGVISRLLAKGEPFRALEVPIGDIHVLGTPAQVESWCRGRAPPAAARLAFCLSALRAPSSEAAAFCRTAFAQGHHIVVLTPADLALSEVKTLLRRNNLNYHELVEAGEPNCDFLVCSHALDPLLGTLERQSGYYSGGIPAPPASGQQASVQASAGRAARSIEDLAAAFGLGLFMGAVITCVLSKRS
ncbi:unnamed protein product [Polarella glacialis]|uniref:MobA-like NTP transferase domain-containing protein n=1 Tax=Polarella glacialis TaxID=89957 RepID=A0A813EDL1_POLGL|nr:unnamed protein product [Polarella glacialis]CAE8610193.1 unnamed protein product [Polarella glacialis]CAE8646441.1 unnamed protein product [Polarella glacialis]